MEESGPPCRYDGAEPTQFDAGYSYTHFAELSRAYCTAGNRIAIKMAMMAITTHNSVSVNPCRFGRWMRVANFVVPRSDLNALATCGTTSVAGRLSCCFHLSSQSLRRAGKSLWEASTASSESFGDGGETLARSASLRIMMRILDVQIGQVWLALRCRRTEHGHSEEIIRPVIGTVWVVSHSLHF